MADSLSQVTEDWENHNVSMYAGFYRGLRDHGWTPSEAIDILWAQISWMIALVPTEQTLKLRRLYSRYKASAIDIENNVDRSHYRHGLRVVNGGKA
jgi:hypothetical protein